MSGGGSVGSTVSSAASAPINTVAQNTASPPSAQSTPPANNSGGQLGQLQGNFGPMQNPFFYQQPMYGGGFGGGYNQQSMQNPFFYQQPMYGGGYGGPQMGGGFGGGYGGPQMGGFGGGYGGPQMGGGFNGTRSMDDPRSYLNPNRSMLLPDYASSDDFSRRGGPRPSLPLGGLQEVLSNFPRNTRAMPMDNPYGQQQQYSQANQNPYGQPMGGMRGGYGGIDSLLGGRGGFGFMYKKGGKV